MSRCSTCCYVNQLTVPHSLSFQCKVSWHHPFPFPASPNRWQRISVTSAFNLSLFSCFHFPTVHTNSLWYATISFLLVFWLLHSGKLHLTCSVHPFSPYILFFFFMSYLLSSHSFWSRWFDSIISPLKSCNLSCVPFEFLADFCHLLAAAV